MTTHRNSSFYHEFKTALREGLAALPALAEVQVTSADMGKDTAREAIALLDGELTQEWAALGRGGKNETVEFDMGILIIKPGAGEAVIQAARARAFELLGIVESYLLGDPSVGATTRASALFTGRVTEGAGPQGRVCGLMCRVTAPLNRIIPSG